MTDRQSILNIEYATALDKAQPSMLLLPRLFIDGDMWCALYGDNLQDGVAGFGKSPSRAFSDFDRAWITELKSVATKDDPRS